MAEGPASGPYICGSIFRRNRERQRGSAMVLFITLLAFVLIPIAGLAIDASIMYVVKSKLVTAVDSASLAAGRSLSTS